MKKLDILLVFMVAGIVFCNRGLTPTGTEPLPQSDLPFPVEVSGGEMTGHWIPASENPLEAALVNPEALTGMVDSLILHSRLSGSLTVEPEMEMVFDSLLIQIYPDVYFGGMKIPVSPFIEFVDTTITYQQPWSNVVVVPIKTTFLKIDTLGYSATGDSLTLVTKPVGFPGFEFAEYYLLFRFVKE
ncbi:MAG: hypothetical protein GXO74_01860 [Calditrichaeota bacterium]|nr:hypothetical protein [Calditrichota bacterium]